MRHAPHVLPKSPHLLIKTVLHDFRHDDFLNEFHDVVQAHFLLDKVRKIL